VEGTVLSPPKGGVARNRCGAGGRQRNWPYQALIAQTRRQAHVWHHHLVSDGFRVDVDNMNVDAGDTFVANDVAVHHRVDESAQS
jgi:hypothetical protein